MTREDIRKLLGGYSTGTLTPAEQHALFAAALEDQELFDALAGEQALRDLLRDPAARAHLLASLDQRPEPWWRWLRRPAAVCALAAGCLAAVVGYGVWHARQVRRPALVAANREVQVAPVQTAPPASPAAEAAPAGAVAERHQKLAAPVSAPAAAADRLASARLRPSAPPQPPPSPAAAPVDRSAPAPLGRSAPPQLEARIAAPSTAMFDRDVAGAANQAPAPPPRQFAAAPKPATLKQEEKGVAGLANQAPVNGTQFAQLPEPGAAAQSAAVVQAGFGRDRKDAAAGATQVASAQAPSNQADQLKVQVGAAAESVEVTAAEPLLETQSASDQQSHRQVANLPVAGRPALQLAAIAPGTREVKWSVLRRAGDGRLSPVAPEGIRAGDAIVVRLEPYADGVLSVSEIVPGAAAPQVLMAGKRVKRAQAVETPAVTLDHPGVLELLVRFTAQTAALPQTIELSFR